MHPSLRTCAVLLAVIPLLACGSLGDEEREALEDNTFYFYNVIVRDALGHVTSVVGHLEAGLLASGMTPEAAMDAVEARIDAHCFLFERTSPTTAELRVRNSPLPSGCGGPFGIAAVHALTSSQDAQGNLVLELEVTQDPGMGDWMARRSFPAGGGTPTLAVTGGGLDTVRRALEFQGTALIEVSPDGLLQRSILDGVGSGTFQGATEQKSWRFRVETLERLESACRPPQGRFVLEAFDGSGMDLEARDVALTFASSELKVTIDGSTQTQTWTEARCACGRSGCHGGAIDLAF